MKLTLKGMIDNQILGKILNNYYEMNQRSIFVIDISGEMIAYANKHISPDLNILEEKMGELPLYLNGKKAATIFFEKDSENEIFTIQQTNLLNSIVMIINGLLEKNNMDLVIYSKYIMKTDSRNIVVSRYEDKIKYLQKRKVMDTVSVMVNMTEKRDLYTSVHQKKVACLARKIAIEMGINNDKIEGIYIAGLLHDIGKIGIPSEILMKPDKLSSVEFEIIKTHVKVAYDILVNIEFPWPIAEIVLQHHEKVNGEGYPNGLKGKEILLEAKILSIADVVEAITSHRPYRASLGLECALEEIRKNSGICYDPDVVNACIRVCSKNDWDSITNDELGDVILNNFNYAI